MLTRLTFTFLLALLGAIALHAQDPRRIVVRQVVPDGDTFITLLRGGLYHGLVTVQKGENDPGFFVTVKTKNRQDGQPTQLVETVDEFGYTLTSIQLPVY